MKKVCFISVALFCTFAVLMFSSCSSILNTVAHIQIKNPMVLTKEESLDYVRENLRSGIQKVYVVPSAPTGRLPKGKRVKYRMKMLERDKDVATMEIIFSYTKARK